MTKEFFKNPKSIIAAIVIVSFIILLFQNTQVVTLRLFFWKVTMSHFIMILITLFIGFIGGYIISAVWRKRSKPTEVQGKDG